MLVFIKNIYKGRRCMIIFYEWFQGKNFEKRIRLPILSENESRRNSGLTLNNENRRYYHILIHVYIFDEFRKRTATNI